MKGQIYGTLNRVCRVGQILGEDFAKICGLLRIYELYNVWRRFHEIFLNISCTSKIDSSGNEDDVIVSKICIKYA